MFGFFNKNFRIAGKRFFFLTEEGIVPRWGTWGSSVPNDPFLGAGQHPRPESLLEAVERR